MTGQTTLIASIILILGMFFVRYSAATNSRINSLKSLMEITLEDKKAEEEKISQLATQSGDDNQEALSLAKEELALAISDHNRYVDKYNEIVSGSFTGLIAKLKKAKPAKNI